MFTETHLGDTDPRKPNFTGAGVATIGAALAAVTALWAHGLTAWPHLILMVVTIGWWRWGRRGVGTLRRHRGGDVPTAL